MSKVLVTGGLGYIGSHTTVELTNQGYDVVVVDNLSNSRIEVLEGINKITGQLPEFVKGDLTDLAFCREVFSTYPIDSIIHFAAFKAVGESVEKPLKYYRNNIISLLNLLESGVQHDVAKFIFSSSCTVYGQPKNLPVTEDSPVQVAESPYGNTKQINEEMIHDFVSVSDKMKAISLRYFNPIGAHESAEIGELPLGVPANLVPFVTQTAAGIRDKLKVFGGDYNTPDGTCIRDYIHVVDLAKAHISALNHCDKMDSNYDVFNIGTGQGSSVLEVINFFEKVSGMKLNYEIADKRPGDVEKTYADTTKARLVLGWKSEFDLDDMMSSAWKWQQKLMVTHDQ